MRYKLSYLTLITITFFAIICATVCHSAGPIYTGEVVRVIDGDTIHVKEYATKELHKVRLYGIDAPELEQPYGQNSKAALEAVLKYHTVQVQVKEKDKYQREIAYVNAKGADISAFMLQYGYAWHYGCFDSSGFYKQLELYAKDNRLGLWATDTHIPPWIWRHNNKK